MSNESGGGSREPGIEAVSREMRPEFRRIVGRSGIPAIDAEDLIQETLISAFLQWDRIRNRRAWLRHVLRYRCVRYWERQRAQRMEIVDSTILEHVAALGPPPQDREVMYVDLERLLGRLKRRHAALIRLRYGLGLSLSETAERLGYSQGHIGRVILNVVARLRRELSKCSRRSNSAGRAGQRRRFTEAELVKIAGSVLAEREAIATAAHQNGI